MYYTEEEFDAYVRVLIDEIESADVTALEEAVSVQTASTNSDPIACAEIVLMYGGPTLVLKKSFGEWTVEGSYGLCDSLSCRAEENLDAWLESIAL